MKKISIIAETAWHHDGDFNFMNDLIENIITQTKTDYIKLHLSIDFDEYMSGKHSAYDFLKCRLLSKKQWHEIINQIQLSEKKIMLLFNDKKAIDFGMPYKPDLVEIHSVCLNDIKLLRHLKNNVGTKTKIILGVGGSNLYEIENAINILQNNNIVLMHGFQNYPTKYENINFRKIRKIMKLFSDFEHGYADHTAWNNDNNVLITLLGAALGMDYLEKHVSIVAGERRTDWQAAVNIEKFIEIQEYLKILEIANGDGKFRLNEGEKAYSTFGINKKAAMLNKDVKQGEKVKLDDFDFKRTGKNSDLSQLNIIDSIGKIFATDLAKGHCINKIDMQ